MKMRMEMKMRGAAAVVAAAEMLGALGVFGAFGAFGVAKAEAAERYAGGDISLLPDYESAGAKYFDHDGEPIAEFLPWGREQGMNAMRVRLFVNPERYREAYGNDPDAELRYDPNACQDLNYILSLCREIVASGMDLMLDFHYSDTWADPAKQWTPLDWEGLTDEQLAERVHDYTKTTLQTLKDAGAAPAFIQTGNEISYGMLWGAPGTDSPQQTLMGSEANWERLGMLLGSAAQACREVCPEAKIVIHTERAAQVDVLLNFYRKLAEMGADYDIIGLSYYPFWHGDLTQLDTALTALEDGFPEKNIMIVETGYGLLWQVPYPGIIDHTAIWPVSEEGQARFASELVDTLERHSRVNGLFWWWMEYNPFGTDLSGWYNAPLFDPTTGRASAALEAVCSFAKGSGGLMEIRPEMGPESEVWYDLWGNKAPGSARGFLFSSKGKKRFNR